MADVKTPEQAFRDLNNAAYAAIRATLDTTAYPNIDRHKLRMICRLTDEIVDNKGEPI